MRVEESARPLVRRTLQWIAYAERPALSDEQLLEIVAIDENDEELDPEACPDLEDLLRYCGSLVRRTSGSLYDYTNNSWCTSTILELAHFTVQEFLEAIIPNDTELNEFRLSPTDKLTLAKTCLNYLCLPSFNRPPVDFEKDFEDHPFYDHVSRYLIIYIHRFAHEENLQKRLQKLFRPPKSHNLTRFVLHNIQNPGIELRKEGRFNKVCSYEFGSIHVAAMLRLGTVCQWLIDEGCDTNQKSMLGTPLELAIIGTRFERKIYRDFHNPPPPLRQELELSNDDGQGILSTLFENGAIWNTEGVDTESLRRAVFLVSMEDMIVMLRHGMPLATEIIERLEKVPDSRLIKKFSDVIDDVENAKIPLEVKMRVLDLARTRHIELEASGLPIDTTRSTTKMLSDKAYAEAIVYTAKYGPVSNLLHLTTDERFSVNMKGPCQSATLLHIAAERNSTQCMELLLDKHFDAAHLDKHGRSVLHCAIDSGVQDVALLRRLVQSNATEIVDCDGRSVWHAIAKEGRLDVLDILITELGSNHPYLCMQNKLGRTPLLEAVLFRQSYIASRILRSLPMDKTFGMDPRVVHSAIATGLEDFFRELVEMGASLHIRSDQDQSALYFITQETTPGILRTLLDHGLDVDHLDSYGRSPFLDFLEVDQHSQRLEALGYSESDCTDLDRSVMELLATPFCAMAQDKESNSAWLYFCAKTIPHNLLRLGVPSKVDLLVGLFDILIERGALKAYEEATINSGIASLIKTCIDTVSKASIPDQKVILPSVKAILRHVLEATTSDSLLVTHSQAVRLLIWSITQSDDDVCEQLIRLGVDVHATCEYYGENSAVDIAIERTIGEKPFEMILANADPVRIPKLDANGSMRHFVLFRPAELTNKENEFQLPVGEAQGKISTSVSKLEGLLRKGVDPNVGSVHGWTAAMIAAVEGQLECMKLLVAYSADLLRTDRNGYTVIHYAATNDGPLILLEYLRRVIQSDENWRRSATLIMSPSGPDRLPLGPLSGWEYSHCSLTHFAAYRYTSDTLQFLRDEDIVGNINAEAQDGVTPLHLAVCMNSPHTTRWLLKNGADIKVKCGKRKISALHIAMRWGCLENAIALIEAGAEFCADSGGITPEMQVNPAICADLLELLPNVGVPVSSIVMEGIRKRLKMNSSGSLYGAIVKGDVEACSSIIATTPCFPRVVEECGPCTPLIVALAHDQLENAKLFLDHGASTNGVACRKIRWFGYEASALEIAVRNPLFNSILEQLLKQCLLHETHWSQRFGYWRPFHIAAAFNPGAIEILANHALKHVELFRYVTAIRCTLKDTLGIYQSHVIRAADMHTGIVYT
jgi:ankyrin repeat protein